MTNEELLSVIKQRFVLTEDGATATGVREHQLRNMLVKVIELHKSIDNPNFSDSDKWCWQCAEGRGYAKYPCPTIQAIESELNV